MTAPILAALALTLGLLAARSASAQGYDGCYIESYTPDGIPTYSCRGSFADTRMLAWAAPSRSVSWISTSPMPFGKGLSLPRLASPNAARHASIKTRASDTTGLGGVALRLADTLAATPGRNIATNDVGSMSDAWNEGSGVVAQYNETARRTPPYVRRVTLAADCQTSVRQTDSPLDPNIDDGTGPATPATVDAAAIQNVCRVGVRRRSRYTACSPSVSCDTSVAPQDVPGCTIPLSTTAPIHPL
jgi:hypothetical protein